MSEPVVRVGVLGLGRAGSDYLDALRTQPDCSLAGAWDGDAKRSSAASRSTRLFVTSDELVRSADVDLVLCTDRTAEWRVLETALAEGKHLALEPGVVREPAAAERLAALARARRRAIVALNPSCREDDYRAATAAVGRPELGALRRVDFRLWTPPPVPSAVDAAPRSLLLTEGSARIDQLARLVTLEPEAVFCDLVEPGAATATTADSFLDGGALFLQVRFQGGMVARIDIDRRTCLTVPGTWTISGATGGFTHGRLHQTTDEGEVFETPWQPPPPTDDPWLENLASALRAPAVDRHWTRAVRILSAAVCAARDGGIVPT